MRSKPFLVAGVMLVVGCGPTAAAPQGAPPSSRPLVSASPSLASVAPASTAPASLPPTVPPTITIPTTLPASTTALPASPPVDPAQLADISMTWVPPDVIVPTSESLLSAANPINGPRGGLHPLSDAPGCVSTELPACLTGLLDILGFDVTSGSEDDRSRRVARATAVVQLDAGLPMTGTPDDALLRYLGATADTTGTTGTARSALDAGADEVRQIGTSGQARPITALRYGDGPRTVLVVGQTHGDEEGGLRVLLRARSLPVPDGITLWVVPTMNPDGLLLDTRFLANGADPNRRAPSQPEQFAVHELAVAIRPSLTIWYHQNYGWIGGSGASMGPAAKYQALTGLGTLKRSGDCGAGFMWCPIDHALGSSSILVELPDVLTPADVHRHALALLAVAADQSGF